MPARLGMIDVLVLAASLVAVVLIGLTVSGRTRDLEAYLLGDRDLPWWAILGSIVATETSTATVLSVPGLGYGDVGLRFLQLPLGFLVGRWIVARRLLPLYFDGKLFTAYEVLDRRFGARTKQAASLLFLATRNLGDGLRLFLAAIVLQDLADWPFGLSVVTMGVVTIFYTYFGGMRSVVWNDCLQFVIYMVGAVAAVFVIAAHVPGGWREIVDYGAAHDKLRVFEFRLAWDQAYNFWAGLCGGAVLTIGTHGTDHMMVQRYLSARSQRDAARAVTLSGVVVFVQFALFLLIGVELAAYYAHVPELRFPQTDKVFSHFIVHVFPQNTGLVGLMLAAILAAAMSTLSSSLNSSASALVNDFYLPARRTPLTPERALQVTRGMTIFFGLLQMAIGYCATFLAGAVVSNALTIAGFAAGLLLGVYALGVLTRSVGQSAALTGAAVGLCALVCVQFVAPAMGWKKLAFPWLALLGAATTFAAGGIVALVFPRQGESST